MRKKTSKSHDTATHRYTFKIHHPTAQKRNSKYRTIDLGAKINFEAKSTF